MKKSMIAAGAASLALAAMPVLGAFAIDQTDTLIVRITDSCALTRVNGAGAHTNGTGANAGAWGTSGTASAGDEGHADTLTGVVANGGTANDFGKSHFHVVCNNLSGWRVTAEATALTAGTPANGSIGLGTTGGASSAWSYTSDKGEDTDNTFTASTTGTTTASTVVASKTSATDTAGKDFNITYKVTVSSTQPADDYKGNIGYTLVKGAE